MIYLNKNRTVNSCQKDKNIVLFISLALAIVVCLAFAVFNSENANADVNSGNDIATSQNFLASDDGVVPFSFWQKTVSVNGQDMDETYNYVFQSLNGAAPMPDGSIDQSYEFSMIGSTTYTFKIDYSKVEVQPYNWIEYNYRASLIKPDPGKENYTYDDTYFDVRVHLYKDGETLKSNVLCFNPQGEKVYDPGWTVIFNKPVPDVPDTPVNKVINVLGLPQTLDANTIIVMAVLGVLALCIGLAIGSKISRKRKEQKN